jgi:hypothetical protein
LQLQLDFISSSRIANHPGFSRKEIAMRRIQTARCIREFPEIFGMLEKNELNLTRVCLLANILNETNKMEVFKEARFKSKRQMEEIVARYKPDKEIQDRVRTVIFEHSSRDTSEDESLPCRRW